jgi:hypothetical protein
VIARRTSCCSVTERDGLFNNTEHGLVIDPATTLVDPEADITDHRKRPSSE